MNFIKPDVSTICVGMAASMGAAILASGTKGKRLALPNSMILIHQPSSGVQGQQTDIQIVADETKWIRHHLNELLADRHGQVHRADRQRHRARQLHARDGGLRIRPSWTRSSPLAASRAPRSSRMAKETDRKEMCLLLLRQDPQPGEQAHPRSWWRLHLR